MVHDRPATQDTPASISAIKDAVVGLMATTLAAAQRSRASFVHLAANAVSYELEAADIASRRAKSERVKEFARAARADYGKIGAELKSFSGSANAPQDPPAELDTPFRALIDDLVGAPDGDFDERYVYQQRSIHGAVVTLFKTYRGGGGDGGLTRLCRHGLPVLERTQEEADKLAHSL